MFAKAEGPPRGMTALRASCFNYLVARAWGMGEILGPHNGRENDSLWPRSISQVNFGAWPFAAHVATAKAYLDGNKGMAAESEWLRRAKPLPL